MTIGNARDQEHAAAVASCDIELEATVDGEVPGTTATIDALGRWNTCLVDANDASIPKIEDNLSAAHSDRMGTSAESIQSYRVTHSRLCVLLREGAVGPMSGVSEADCFGRGERAIAAVIDAYAMVDDKTISIEQNRDGFPECYAAFEAHMNAATSEAEMGDAMNVLLTCIQHHIDDNGHAVAQQMLDIGARSGLDEAEVDVLGALDAANGSAEELCAVLASAGSSADPTPLVLNQSACRVDSASLLSRSVAMFVAQ